MKGIVFPIAPGDLLRLGNLTFLLLHSEPRGYVLAAVLPSNTRGLKRVTGDIEAGEHLVRTRSTRLIKGQLTSAFVVGRLAQDQLVECIREAAKVRGKTGSLRYFFPPDAK